MKCKVVTLIFWVCCFALSVNAGGKGANKIELPTMGWSSWNTYHVNINDSLIKRQADAMVALGLDDVGYRYVNIDDGYFGGRGENGKLKIHSVRFPKGLKPVVDHIHSLGLKAGIYSDAGRNTCGFYYDKDTIAHGVGLYGFDVQDTKFFFKDMGFDFIKVDFCGGNGLGGEPVLDEETRYRAIADAIRKTGRKDVRLNVCRWDYPGTWVKDVALSWRISHDIRPRWSSIKDIIAQNMYLSAYAGGGHYNDMDMLEVGRGLTDEEDKTHFGMWCMMASPLLIGCDLMSLNDHTLELIKNPSLIGLNQSQLGLQAYVVERKDSGYILVKDLNQLNGKVRAVAFYNSGDEPLDMTLYFRDVDLGGRVKATDLYAGKDAGVYVDCMRVKVPAHGTRIFRLEAEQRLPRVKYEAETAYISDYQELSNYKVAKTGVYVEDDKCSGGAKAINLGWKPENDLIWDNVYVDRKGEYQISVAGMTPEPRNVYVEVNGKDIGVLEFNGDGTQNIVAKLKKGNNRIRLYNSKEAMPDVDYITVIPNSETYPDKLTLSHLTIEGREDYHGCDEMKPRFGWWINTDSGKVKQTDYRILVSSDKQMIDILGADIWDSGRVTSNQSQWVEYAGKPLEPSEDYYWRVKVWTDRGETPWSPVAEWSTGIMDPKGDRAMWIVCDTLEAGDSQQRHSRLRGRYFRKQFTMPDKKVKRAVAHISGLGFYTLDMNGERIGNDVLTPSPTDYTKSVIYNSYDVTDKLGKDNVVGVTLAPGYYYAMAQNYQTNVRTTYGFPKLWMRLVVEFEDGSKEEIVSDESWKLTTDGPLRYSNIYDGEMYDSRRELSGWTLPGYDDSRWGKAEIVAAPGGNLVGNILPPMCVYEEEKPSKITKTDNGWLVDFGTNNSGRISFTSKGEQGDTVKVRYAEMTLPGDTLLYTANLRSAECTDRYICDGKRKSWHPEYTWQGFRYVEISPIEAVDTATISRRLVADRMDSSDMEIEFVTNDTILSKVLENARRGIMSNYKGMPIDCPQRDERMPWLGDRTTGALGESYIVDNHALYSKWVKDIRECQRENGAISDVAPSYWRLYNTNITWPAALPMVCDMLYRQYGDLRPMEQSYDAIEKWLGYVKGKSMKDGLLTYDRYGDWCVPPESQNLIHSKDPDRVTDGKLIASCYYYYLCKLMEEYAPMVGRDDHKNYYADEAEKIKNRINEEFLHDGKYSNSTVTANLLPLAMGIVPDSDRDKVHSELIRVIRDVHDCHIGSGVIGIQWLMRYLSQNGENDLAWRIATTDSYPGWGYMVKNGATTIWELWNGNTADPAMNSGNHVMLLGDLLVWCYESLGGIAPSEPGFKKVTVNPDFNIPGLDGVKVSHKSPYGVIRSEWKRNGDKMECQVELPGNCEFEINNGN